MKLIKISKPNCVPCSTVANQLFEYGVSYEEYNIKDKPELIEKYRLNGVPVVILFDDNENEVSRVSGVNPPELDKLVKLFKEGTKN